MLAYHWSSALELVRASGGDDDEIVERTRRALRAAGDRAFALNSYAVAVAQYEDALALWPEDAERPELLFRLAARASPVLRRRAATGGARSGSGRTAGGRRHGARLRSRVVPRTRLAGSVVSTISSGSISRALRLSPATRSRPRRRASWPSRDGSARSQARRRKGDASPRPPSRRRRSSGSTSFEPMRSRRSAWRRTTPTSGRAAPTWSVPSRSLSRPTPPSPRRSSTTSPSTRCLRATSDALTSSTPRRRASPSGTETRRASASSVATSSFSTSFSGAGTARSSRRTRSSPSARRGRRTCSSTSRAKYARRLRLARGDQDAALRDQLRAFEQMQGRHERFHIWARLPRPRRCYAELGRSDEARAFAVRVPPMVREVGLHGALMRLGLFADELGIGDELREAVAAGAGPRLPFWQSMIDAHPGGRARLGRRPHGVGRESDSRGATCASTRACGCWPTDGPPMQRPSSSARSRSTARSTRRPTSPQIESALAGAQSESA